MSRVTLTPAYGRDYKNKKDVLRDWKEGKDFTIASMMHPYNGKYTSIRDHASLGSVSIRYKNSQEIVVVGGK